MFFGRQEARAPEAPVNGTAVGNEIIYTEAGFSPRMLRVEQGATVVFKNESDGPVWPASNIHPTHTVYPGSGIEKCRSAEREEIFDACEGISPGEAYEFTFAEAGEWGYHNHLRASHTGTVIVE